MTSDIFLRDCQLSLPRKNKNIFLLQNYYSLLGYFLAKKSLANLTKTFIEWAFRVAMTVCYRTVTFVWISVVKKLGFEICIYISFLDVEVGFHVLCTLNLIRVVFVFFYFEQHKGGTYTKHVGIVQSRKNVMPFMETSYPPFL